MSEEGRFFEETGLSKVGSALVGIGASFFLKPPNLNITGKPEVLKSGESESGIIQHSLPRNAKLV